MMKVPKTCRGGAERQKREEMRDEDIGAYSYHQPPLRGLHKPGVVPSDCTTNTWPAPHNIIQFNPMATVKQSLKHKPMNSVYVIDVFSVRQLIVGQNSHATSMHMK